MDITSLKTIIDNMMKERLRAGMPFLGFLLCPVLTFILTEVYLYNPFTDMKRMPWCLNLLIYWLTAAILVMLTGRLRAALRIQTVFFLLAGLANYYVVNFRSSPILPWDIFSAKTAASVADNFSYALSARACFVLLGFGGLLLAEQLFPYRIRRGKLRLILGISCILLLTGLVFVLHNDAAVSRMRLYNKMFTPGVVQKRNGMVVAFTMELKYLVVEKPAGYDAEECRTLLAAYEKTPSETEKRPNIIVIMDEAFADMSYLGDVETNKEYMPFFRSLQEGENTVSGSVHVSVLGGNTANTEFEFLTGNTMAFLPEGSVPYQQYLRGELPSLASRLKEEGYATVAMHPYHAAGWCRDKVYSWMGFDVFRALPDYPDAEYVRKYVSDQADFERIIQEYEQRDREKPIFLFNVTMQNHGGYDQEFDNFVPEITGTKCQSKALDQYLSLISLTDQALQELIGYFMQEEEETIILFFGDHQPNDSVAGPIWRQNGVNASELSWEQETVRYEVPFVLWANFDIEAKKDLETSANFLALEVLEQADIFPDGYFGYLEELHSSYSVISARQIVTTEGQVLTEEETKEAEDLLTYRRLQYYMMSSGNQADVNR